MGWGNVSWTQFFMYFNLSFEIMNLFKSYIVWSVLYYCKPFQYAENLAIHSAIDQIVRSNQQQESNLLSGKIFFGKNYKYTIHVFQMWMWWIKYILLLFIGGSLVKLWRLGLTDFKTNSFSGSLELPTRFFDWLDGNLIWI